MAAPPAAHLHSYERTPAALARGQALRERLGVGADDTLVLHAGRLNSRGEAHLTPLFRSLELARRLYRKSPIHLLLIGQFTDALTEDCFDGAHWTCAPSVPIHWIDGMQADVASVSWFAADIFIALSDNVQDRFGPASLQAMAASLPCVVSDWAGYKEGVTDGETGIRVPTTMAPAAAGVELAATHARRALDHATLLTYAAQCTAVDIDAAAKALASLAGDPERRRHMGEAGRVRAEALWADVAEVARAHSDGSGDDSGCNPFAVFAHYPSRSLADDSLVALADPDALYSFRLIRGLPINDLARDIVLGNEQMEAMIGRLEAGPLAVADLLAGYGDNERATATRSILWLYKFGIATVPLAGARQWT
jgi:alpha-maltose-1-phosphate synthase